MGVLRLFFAALISVLLLSWIFITAMLHYSVLQVNSPKVLRTTNGGLQINSGLQNVQSPPNVHTILDSPVHSILHSPLYSHASSTPPATASLQARVQEPAQSSPKAPASPPPELAPVSSSQSSSNFQPSSTAILILVYNRVKYFRQCIAALQALPEFHRYKLIVSQDGNDVQMTNAVDEAKASLPNMLHIQHAHPPKPFEEAGVLFFIASHYKFALDSVFRMGLSHVIVLEDDLLVSPDFLRMFEALAPILDKDSSIMCISSFNDNGFSHLHLPPNMFMRTNYFPGLGWMMRSDVWRELSPKFPQEAWDHWMRTDSQHRGRDCIIPYLSRNKNIGEEGSTVESGIFERLKNMPRNEDARVEYGDLSYLLRENYVNRVKQMFQKATISATPTLASDNPPDVQLSVYTRESFAGGLASRLKILPSPRAYFEGVMVILLTPSATLLVADARACPYLPGDMKVSPNSLMKTIAGPEGGNCLGVCSNEGFRCDAGSFDFVNSCKSLSEFFPCESGCDYNVGSDIPNYVSNRKNARHFAKCLVTDAFPTCDASHWSTRRLCPCVPL